MTSTHDPVIEDVFRRGLSRIPAMRSVRVRARRRPGTRRSLLVGAALALLAVLGLTVGSIESTATTSGFSCADIPTKVRVWLASLPAGAEWHVIDINGVPHLVSQNGGATAVAPAGALVQAGCVPMPASSPSLRVP